jgi:hypothetical protein
VIQYLQLINLQSRSEDLESLSAQARHIESRAWINVLDWSVASAIYRLVTDYVRDGSAISHPKWIPIGSILLAPSARVWLSPLGIEYSLQSQMKIKGRLSTTYARWTEKRDQARQVGGGGSLQFGTATSISTILVDVWRPPNASVRLRTEVSLEQLRMPSTHLHVLGAVGRKGVGYLPGFPFEAGFYVTGGLRILIDR